MTFKELKEAIEELDERQLDMVVEIRTDEISTITIAVGQAGVPFFAFESTDDAQ